MVSHLMALLKSNDAVIPLFCHCDHSIGPVAYRSKNKLYVIDLDLVLTGPYGTYRQTCDLPEKL
jgi:hypothetical protein